MPIINIDEPVNANKTKAEPGYGGIVSHVMTLVRDNRAVRDRKYKDKWDSFERTFRGMYSGQDKTREGERSKLVTPALAASIESTCATIEDAIFGRERWFDLVDDVLDQQPQDIQQMHKQLEEDLDLANVPDAIAKVVLNGSLYGTGIGKINVTRREIRKMVNGKVQKDWRPLVTLDPIPPWEFVIDSQARDIESAYFCAHETNVPRKVIWSRMKSGQYRKVALFGNNSTDTQRPAGEETPDGANKPNEFDGSVFVTEYYGLIPAAMLLEAGIMFEDDDIQGNGQVECVVTIGNELEVLRCTPNPFITKDRPIIAYQHSVVPGKFWGRGVAEKGWNAQRALDAELRARMDALALITSPMMGADITRLPRNPDMRVRPGKVWLTRGRPSEVLEPVILGNIDPNTFNQSSEMERLVQVGTGAIESNAPLNVDRRNETASGISMIQSSALKRMRRTMWNVERQFLNPLVRKALMRMQQFNPTRYTADAEFGVKGTMGIVAREFEQAQLIGMLSNIPPESEYYNLIIRSVIELSVSPKRDEILQQLDAMKQKSPEQQKMEQEMQQLQMESQREALREQQVENTKTEMEIKKLEAEIKQIVKMTQLEDEKVDIQAANTALGKLKVDVQKRQVEVQREKNHMDAKAKEKASANRPAKPKKSD
jgi:hypothetical protein